MRLLKYFVLSLITVLFLVYAYLVIVNRSINYPAAKASESYLRITAFNIHAGNKFSAAQSQKILETKSDVIVITEWNGNNIDLSMFTQKGYTVLIDHPRKVVHGICILSKHGGSAEIMESPIATPCALPLGMIRFIWNNKPITLIGVHAPPPVPDCKGTNDDYLKAIAGWVDSGLLAKDIGVGKKGDIVILAGDFNALSFSEGITELKNKKLNSCFDEYTLPKPTWSPFLNLPPIAQIDHILLSDTFDINTATRFPVEGSDHLGLSTDIILK